VKVWRYADFIKGVDRAQYRSLSLYVGHTRIDAEYFNSIPQRLYNLMNVVFDVLDNTTVRVLRIEQLLPRVIVYPENQIKSDITGLTFHLRRLT